MRVSGMTGSAISLPALKALHHRRAAFGLNDGKFGYAVYQAHGEQFLEALIHTQRPQPAADGLDIPIRCAPAKLFHDLIRNGLHRFARGDGTCAAIQKQILALCKLTCDLFCLIVIAADSDDLCAEERGFPQLFLRNEAGHKDPELDPSPGTSRGIRHRRIACGCDDRFANIVFIHRGDCNCGLTVFEGGCRAVAFILEVNMSMPKIRREAL